MSSLTRLLVLAVPTHKNTHNDLKLGGFRYSDAVEMIRSLFWDVTLRGLVVNRRFWATWLSHLQEAVCFCLTFG
jgi:hypothetical protein